MSYRDDLDALAARHAALEREIAEKQRELAEVAAMLVEARRVDQAASHFAAPAVRQRRQRRAAAGALTAALALGGGLGFAASTQGPPGQDGLAMHEVTGRLLEAFAAADRRQATYDALREIGLISKDQVKAVRRAREAGIDPAHFLVRQELARAGILAGAPVQVPAPRPLTAHTPRRAPDAPEADADADADRSAAREDER